MQNQNKTGLLSTKTVQTLPRLQKTNSLTIHPKELHSHQTSM